MGMRENQRREEEERRRKEEEERRRKIEEEEMRKMPEAEDYSESDSNFSLEVHYPS